jgi:hypothetical protein
MSFLNPDFVCNRLLCPHCHLANLFFFMNIMPKCVLRILCRLCSYPGDVLIVNNCLFSSAQITPKPPSVTCKPAPPPFPLPWVCPKSLGYASEFLGPKIIQPTLLKNSIEISIRIYFSILYYLSKNGW